MFDEPDRKELVVPGGQSRRVSGIEKYSADPLCTGYTSPPRRPASSLGTTKPRQRWRGFRRDGRI